jgi:outer membrane protein assembly factor BamC
MKQFVRCSLLPAGALVVLAQSACSSFYTDERPEVQYQRAYSAEQLEAPPDLSEINRTAGFVVSGAEGGKIQRNTLLPSLNEVRFVREGSQSWLELAATVEDLWPLVRRFIIREGYLLKNEVPLSGYIQTTWAEEYLTVPKSGFSGVIDQTLGLIRPTTSLTSFVFRFERSGKLSTRLFVSHRTIEEQRVDDGKVQDDGEYAWRDAEHDPEIEAQVLTRLMVFLGIDVQRAKGILNEIDLAQLESPAYIVESDLQDVSLFIAQTMPIAWNKVEIALENLLFLVEDDDFERGRFGVSYAGAFYDNNNEQAQSVGWFKGITEFFSSGNENTRGYLVLLRDQAGGTYLKVSDANGEALSTEEEHALLNAIRLQLI